MEESDLVVLRYADNWCCTQVVDFTNLKEDPKVKERWPKNDLYSMLSADLKNETWSWGDEGVENMQIGRGLRARALSYFIIGVYDRTKTSHLNQMVKDSTEALRR